MSHREYIARRLVNLEGAYTIWGDSILSAYARASKFSFVPSFGLKQRSDLVVLGAKIFNQLTDQTRSHVHLAMTARDAYRLQSIPRSFSYDLKSYRLVHSLLANNDEKAYELCRGHFEKTLSKTQATTLVANSTIDPINRLWLKTARDLGLKTACVQHGIYAEAIPSYVLEEDIVDRYVALDQGQAAILEKNIPAQKIFSLGTRQSFEWVPPHNTLKICFVGEDWERYGLDRIKRLMIEKYKALSDFFKSQLTVDLYYKPHPSEELLLDIADHATVLKHEQIDIPDVYIGFASTFLKDMSSRGKLAIQVLDPITRSDNFSTMGYCLSLDNDDMLAERLLSIFKNSAVVPFIQNRQIDDLLFF